MLSTNQKKLFSTVLLVSALVMAASTEALADRGRDGHRGGGWRYSGHGRRSHYRHHPYYGRKVSFPEALAKAFVHAGLDYYYHHGYFYQRAPYGYVIVDAPSGVVLRNLPSGHKIVVVNGRRYYYYNDIYYLRNPKGYIVVDDPVYDVVEIPQEVKVIEADPAPGTVEITETDDSFTVNIPNASGSFTPVVLKKSGEGFVGPQGEYYSKFPSVEQLKVMYGQS